MNQYLGEIQIFPYYFTPKGWRICDGTILSIQEYQLLFSLIGTTYGGDGRTMFQLPDLRYAAMYSSGKYYDGPLCAYFIAMEGAYPSKP